MRLIDADALKKEFNVFFGGVAHAVIAAKIIDEAPSAVLCKDCMFCKFDDSSETYMCRSMRGLYRPVEAEEFCSRGER